MRPVGEPQVESHFATAVLAAPWPDAPNWNAPLRDAILARRQADRGVSKSNLLGWQSDLNLHRWGGEAALRLRAHAIDLCSSISEGQGDRPWIAEMWANASPPGASNQTHAHPGSLWSVVYYVEDGYAGSPDKALGGELTFLDPRFPMVRMAMPDLRYRRPNGTLDNQEVWMRPRSGLIVIFPSWLQHAVRPYHGRGVRLSIAINLWLGASHG